MAGKPRSVRIRQGFGQERGVSVRLAPSLKQALLDFYEETLKGYGYTKPKVVGNVLTVRFRSREMTYVAEEAR